MKSRTHCRILLLLLLAENFATDIAYASTTSLNLPDFTSASQTAVGGLTFNGAATSDGTLTRSFPYGNPQEAGTFFFNQPINATLSPSFSAFYYVIYDTSKCYYGYCDDGVALILQTYRLNFYSSTEKWGILNGVPSFAVGFENFYRHEYVLDDGNQETKGSAYPVYLYEYHGSIGAYTWVDYNHGTSHLDVYMSLTNNKTLAAQTISKSGVNIFASGALNMTSFGTYYVGLGASTGLSFTAFPDQEGHKAISMWFNACSDDNAPCGSPLALPTPPPTGTVFTGDAYTLSGPTTATISTFRDCLVMVSNPGPLSAGYTATISSISVCCVTVGFITSGSCETGHCGVTSGSTKYTSMDTADGSLCYTNCYQLGTASSATGFNGTAYTGGATAFDTVSTYKSIYIQSHVSSSLSAAYLITAFPSKRSPTPNQYGCTVKGSYDGTTCSIIVGCNPQIPSDYFYNSNTGGTDCYAFCITA